MTDGLLATAWHLCLATSLALGVSPGCIPPRLHELGFFVDYQHVCCATASTVYRLYRLLRVWPTSCDTCLVTAALGEVVGLTAPVCSNLCVATLVSQGSLALAYVVASLAPLFSQV